LALRKRRKQKNLDGVSASFNVNQYWLERGKSYMQETRTPREFHRLQERFLLDVLRNGGVRMRSVLEIGCGFGRITRLLAETWPEAQIMALDLSPEQLVNARRHCGAKPQIRFEQFDFYSGLPFPGGNYDTALAIEVFLHHPPEMVGQLLKQLSDVAQSIVSIDWSEEWTGPLPEHVWLHDYPKMLAEAGMRSAVFRLPQKVGGKQQQLFVAARELPEALTALEERLGARNEPASASASRSLDDWTAQIQTATAELLGVVPTGTSFILVDDEQWGNLRLLSGHRIFSFRERRGVYVGPPSDDAEAWDELVGLGQAGAAFIAFAWPSFWWLDYYKEFSQRLRAECPCVLENERLVIFKLTQHHC
jgi:SAM-dependent methyltransferase